MTTIEDVALTHPDVSQAREFRLGAETAVAVVPAVFSSAVEIRNHVWEQLGDGDPVLVALVDEIPGDPAALVSIVAGLDGTQVSRYTEPDGGLEVALRDIMAETVPASRIGVLDDFIDLGGDSLSAVQLSTLIQERLGVSLRLETVFEASTVRGLATAVRTEAEVAGVVLPGAVPSGTARAGRR